MQSNKHFYLVHMPEVKPEIEGRLRIAWQYTQACEHLNFRNSKHTLNSLEMRPGKFGIYWWALFADHNRCFEKQQSLCYCTAHRPPCRSLSRCCCFSFSAATTASATMSRCSSRSAPHDCISSPVVTALQRSVLLLNTVSREPYINKMDNDGPT